MGTIRGRWHEQKGRLLSESQLDILFSRLGKVHYGPRRERARTPEKRVELGESGKGAGGLERWAPQPPELSQRGLFVPSDGQ